LKKSLKNICIKKFHALKKNSLKINFIEKLFALFILENHLCSKFPFIEKATCIEKIARIKKLLSLKKLFRLKTSFIEKIVRIEKLVSLKKLFA
jgi:hypothetical protein